MGESLTGEIPILMSGLPGKMASLVARSVAELNLDFYLNHVALSSDRHFAEISTIGNNELSLFSASRLRSFRSMIRRSSIALDFTVPEACTPNTILYAELGIPFVMGTSGGNRKEMEEIVRKSRICAVIAANMDPEIIRQQIAIDEFAQNNTGIFRDTIVGIIESHQKTKKDVSGTALAFRSQFEKYGAKPNGRIVSIRDTKIQEALGIPDPESGHAYHWILVRNPNAQIIYRFNTAVQGRSSYVEGTQLAAQFLYRQMAKGSKGQVFTMRDVMEGGE